MGATDRRMGAPPTCRPRSHTPRYTHVYSLCPDHLSSAKTPLAGLCGGEEEHPMIEQSEPLVVLVTGAAGQIAYSLYPHLLNGAVFGSRRISLRLLDLDIPAVQEGVLPGVKMELEDLSYPS